MIIKTHVPTPIKTNDITAKSQQIIHGPHEGLYVLNAHTNSQTSTPSTNAQTNSQTGTPQTTQFTQHALRILR